MADANLLSLAIDLAKPNLGVILEGAAVLGIGGIVRMLSVRFKENTAEHKEIITHLSTVNGRLGKSETWQDAHTAAALRDDHTSEIARAQCQAFHERRLEALSDRFDDLRTLLPTRHNDLTD